MIWEHREGQSTNHTTGKSITCVALNVGAISCPVMDFRFQVADPTSVDGFVIAATGGRFTRGENDQATGYSDVYCVHNDTGYIGLRLASLFDRDGNRSHFCVGDEGCPQRQLPAQAVGEENMDKRMRELLDLLKWYLLGSLVGFPLGMRLAGGTDELLISQTTVMYALMIFGLCGLVILVITAIRRRQHIV